MLGLILNGAGRDAMVYGLLFLHLTFGLCCSCDYVPLM